MITQEAAPYSLILDQDVLERGAIKKFNDEDHACAACGKSVETIEHLLIECRSIHPDVDAGTVTLPEALGFRDKKGNVNKSAVDVSKTRLED